ncbi:MAG: abortive infection protein [Saprospiraceae bacterium]|nr:MAG: abortive infection protein [Saprospiraceae bacterium]
MDFLRQALVGRNHWWRYLLTLVIVFGAILLGQVPFLLVLMWQAYRRLGTDNFEELAHNLDFSFLDISQNLVVLLMLLPFVFGLAALLLCVKHLHDKPVMKVLSARTALDWQRIWFGFLLWIALSGLSDLVFFLLEPGNYFAQYDPGPFWGLVFIAIVFFPLQTSFEEITFRGYLLQGISLLSKWAWVPWVITSILFGALHFMNPEVMAFGAGLAMTYYISTGLFLGFITIMDEGLELALGVHAATNIYAALFVTFDASAIQTPALFRVYDVHLDWMLIAFFLSAALFILLAARRFRWRNWRKCFSEIDPKGISDENNATFV